MAPPTPRARTLTPLLAAVLWLLLATVGLVILGWAGAVLAMEVLGR